MKIFPNLDILNAFGVLGDPVLLAGGEGMCYRVNNVVLKPTNNAVEASWLAGINNSLHSDKFRVPKPIAAKDGSWVFNGWTASEFLPGEHRPGHYKEAIEVSNAFHKSLVDIPKPDWFDQKTDVFSVADKIAWGQLPAPDFEPAKDQIKKLFSFLKENHFANQLIHGDWGPNQILFHDTLPPAVIDMTPYFRPSDYPIADMMISALDHEGADPSILDLGEGIKDFDQLLLRALAFRTFTYIGFQTHPENDRDWTVEINRHLNLLDIILLKLAYENQ